MKENLSGLSPSLPSYSIRQIRQSNNASETSCRYFVGHLQEWIKVFARKGLARKMDASLRLKA